MKLCLRCNQYFEDGIDLCPKDNSSLESVGKDPLIGALINDKYVVESVIGKGSSGIVYKATRLLMGREVAVKVLHSYLGADSGSLDRFLREAKAAGKLKHPHIITLWESGVTDDAQPYFVMDYLEGVTLAELIKDKGSIHPSRALPIIRQVCEALGEAHRQGIVHRDIKPENIVLQETDYADDYVKVLDFGIADAPQENNKKLGKPKTVAGSPAYMSPEQCQGFELDAKSDIYSLAIVVFEMLTGERPFHADEHRALMFMHVTQPPATLEQVRPDLRLPEALEGVLARALAKTPDQRQQTIKEFWRELDEACHGFGFDTAPVATTKKKKDAVKVDTFTVPVFDRLMDGGGPVTIPWGEASVSSTGAVQSSTGTDGPMDPAAWLKKQQEQKKEQPAPSPASAAPAVPPPTDRPARLMGRNDSLSSGARPQLEKPAQPQPAPQPAQEKAPSPPPGGGGDLASKLASLSSRTASPAAQRPNAAAQAQPQTQQPAAGVVRPPQTAMAGPGPAAPAATPSGAFSAPGSPSMAVASQSTALQANAPSTAIVPPAQSTTPVPLHATPGAVVQGKAGQAAEPPAAAPAPGTNPPPAQLAPQTVPGAQPPQAMPGKFQPQTVKKEETPPNGPQPAQAATPTAPPQTGQASLPKPPHLGPLGTASGGAPPQTGGPAPGITPGALPNTPLQGQTPAKPPGPPQQSSMGPRPGTPSAQPPRPLQSGPQSQPEPARPQAQPPQQATQPSQTAAPRASSQELPGMPPAEPLSERPASAQHTSSQEPPAMPSAEAFKDAPASQSIPPRPAQPAEVPPKAPSSSPLTAMQQALMGVPPREAGIPANMLDSSKSEETGFWLPGGGRPPGFDPANQSGAHNVLPQRPKDSGEFFTGSQSGTAHDALPQRPKESGQFFKGSAFEGTDKPSPAGASSSDNIVNVPAPQAAPSSISPEAPQPFSSPDRAEGSERGSDKALEEFFLPKPPDHESDVSITKESPAAPPPLEEKQELPLPSAAARPIPPTAGALDAVNASAPGTASDGNIQQLSLQDAIRRLKAASAQPRAPGTATGQEKPVEVDSLSAPQEQAPKSRAGVDSGQTAPFLMPPKQAPDSKETEPAKTPDKPPAAIPPAQSADKLEPIKQAGNFLSSKFGGLTGLGKLLTASQQVEPVSAAEPPPSVPTPAPDATPSQAPLPAPAPAPASPFSKIDSPEALANMLLGDDDSPSFASTSGAHHRLEQATAGSTIKNSISTPEQLANMLLSDDDDAPRSSFPSAPASIPAPTQAPNAISMPEPPAAPPSQSAMASLAEESSGAPSDERVSAAVGRLLEAARRKSQEISTPPGAAAAPPAQPAPQQAPQPASPSPVTPAVSAPSELSAAPPVPVTPKGPEVPQDVTISDGSSAESTSQLVNRFLEAAKQGTDVRKRLEQATGSRPQLPDSTAASSTAQPQQVIVPEPAAPARVPSYVSLDAARGPERPDPPKPLPRPNVEQPTNRRVADISIHSLSALRNKDAAGLSLDRRSGSRGADSSRARVRERFQKPGIDFRLVAVFLIVLAALAVAGYVFLPKIQSMGLFGMGAPAAGGKGENIAKMISSGKLDQARGILEKKQTAGKLSKTEFDQLHNVYLQLAKQYYAKKKIPNALLMLEKVSPKSSSFAEADKLTKKYKKQLASE